MEAPQEHDSANRNNSSYLCRQSSTRWTPTSDQIRILKELYYNNGIRSPTADQIQRIAARLRQYGKIEGKNVFYWFQNHKARERQKKRFTPATAPPPPATATLYPSSYPHTAGVHVQSHHFYNQQHKLYINPPQTASSCSQGFMAVGCGYGSVSMEKSFRDCSISHGEMIGTGVESYFLDKIKPTSHGSLDEEDGGGELSPEVETLPLFPVHDGATTAGVGPRDVFNVKAVEDSPDHYYTGGNWFRSDGRTSLELSLNSYGYYN